MPTNKFDPSLIDSILMDVQNKDDFNNKNDVIVDNIVNNTQISEDDGVCDNFVVEEKSTPSNKTGLNIDLLKQNIDQLSNQLCEDKNGMVAGRYGEQVDYNKVYEELGALIKYSKDVLETLAAIEPDVADPKQIQATASLINSIKGLVSEFSVIHKMNIKHQYNIELENIKQQHRLSTIEYKQEIRNNQQQVSVEGDDKAVINASIPWSSDLALEFMEFMKQKGKII